MMSHHAHWLTFYSGFAIYRMGHPFSKVRGHGEGREPCSSIHDILKLSNRQLLEKSI